MFTQQKLGMAPVTQLAIGAGNLKLLASVSLMEELDKDAAVVSKESPWERSWTK